MKKVLITGGTGSVGMKLVELFSTENNFNVDFTFHNNYTRAKEMEQKYSASAKRIETYDDIGVNYDIVINNAAILNSLTSCENISLEAWEEALRVNITFPFMITKKNLPHMKQKKWGRIINISSIYGVVAELDVTPYNVTKRALIGLTKSVAKEYAMFGITCNAVCPGTINSELSERLADHYTNSAEQRESYFKAILDTIPAKRLAEPKEVADLVYYIASEKASYINGTTLMIDGGATA